MNVTKDVVYAGVEDKEIELFESQYEVPDGVTYNSYVIFDEKIAVMDTVDGRKTAEWMEKLRGILGDAVSLTVLSPMVGADPQGDGCGGRGAASWKTQSAVFYGSYGSLAGGHGVL